MTGFHFRPNPRMVENKPEIYIGMGLTLRPVFHARGTVTAGNASQTSDGAGAVVKSPEGD